MKRPLLLFALAISLFAGCDSLNRPDYFASGRDARVYNLQTGRYEWPEEEPARPRKPRVKLDEKPADEPTDGRIYNPQTRQYEAPR